MCEVEMSEFSCQMLKAGIKRLREAGTLEYIYYMRLENPADDCVPQEDPHYFPKSSSMCW